MKLLILSGLQSCFAVCYACSPKPKRSQILTVNQVLELFKKEGIYTSDFPFSPNILLSLDSTVADTLVNIEFRNIQDESNPKSDRAKLGATPLFSIDLARNYYVPHAAKRIFDFYKKIPKKAISDRTCRPYYGLNELISILIVYQPTGLDETLKADFCQWKSLAKAAPFKFYRSPEDGWKLGLDSALREEARDSIVDVHQVVLTIGLALQLLGHQEITNQFIDSVRSFQTFPYADQFHLKIPRPASDFQSVFPKLSIPIPMKYRSLNDLINDCPFFSKLISKTLGFRNKESISHIVIENEFAFINIDELSGSSRYRLKVERGTLKLQCLGSTIE